MAKSKSQKEPESLEDILKRIQAKWAKAKVPNSVRALADLEAIESQATAEGGELAGLEDCKTELEAYRDLERSEYASDEEYAEERAEAWKAFIQCLRDLEVEQEAPPRVPVSPARAPVKRLPPPVTPPPRESVVPQRGGFQRPFGAAEFILDYLKGSGEQYGVESIPPGRGAPQAAILKAYKQALHYYWGEDRVAQEKEYRIRKGLPQFSDLEEEERLAYWLGCYPLARCRMRYHSFLIYFGMLKRLDWVEETGTTENSLAQEKMALKKGEKPREVGWERVFYRIAPAGRAADPLDIKNPLIALYPNLDLAHFKMLREQSKKKYVKCK